MKTRKLSTLIPDDHNANKGTKKGAALIKKSLSELGAGRSILLDKNNRIIAGNKTAEQAAAAGFQKVRIIETTGDEIIAVKRMDLDLQVDAKAKQLGVADNRASELSLSWDTDELDHLSKDADIGSIFGETDLAKLLGSKLEPAAEDDLPAVPIEASTQLGDVYILGRHRLCCGDSTKHDDVARLMGGKTAEICFTSPPYNVGKTPNGNTQKYHNDTDKKTSNDYADFLHDATQLALRFSDFAFVNLQSVAGNKVVLIEYLYAMKLLYADTIVWDKMAAEPAMAYNVLNSRFEFIYVFSQKAKRAIGAKKFRGTLENMVFIPSRQDKEFSDIHKATFPVALAEHFVANFSTRSVLDCFAGAGSTLVACERIGRDSFHMELDPRYCDVIIARWEALTGKKALKETAEVV